MSAIKKEIIAIDVTRGDCLENNKLIGMGKHSNTGTYFICTRDKFIDFESFFQEENKYRFNIGRINEYCINLKMFFYDKKKKYIGNMKDLNKYTIYFNSFSSNPQVNVRLRINEPRIFMRFENNNNEIVSSFRNLLYDGISSIIIEKHNKIYYIYPQIKSGLINGNKFVVEE